MYENVNELCQTLYSTNKMSILTLILENEIKEKNLRNFNYCYQRSLTTLLTKNYKLAAELFQTLVSESKTYISDIFTSFRIAESKVNFYASQSEAFDSCTVERELFSFQIQLRKPKEVDSLFEAITNFKVSVNLINEILKKNNFNYENFQQSPVTRITEGDTTSVKLNNFSNKGIVFSDVMDSHEENKIGPNREELYEHRSKHSFNLIFEKFLDFFKIVENLLNLKKVEEKGEETNDTVEFELKGKKKPTKNFLKPKQNKDLNYFEFKNKALKKSFSDATKFKSKNALSSSPKFKNPFESDIKTKPNKLNKKEENRKEHFNLKTAKKNVSTYRSGAANQKKSFNSEKNVIKNPFKILYSTEDLVAIYKKPSLALFSNYKVKTKTLYELKNPEHEIIHTLDKRCSGLLLLAKNNKGKSKLLNYFEGNKREKLHHYFTALVSQPVKNEDNHFQLVYPSFKDIRYDDENPVLEAKTQYKVLKTSSFGSLVLLKSVTNSKHQLRVHLAKVLNSPIIGDFTYGYSQPYYLSEFFHDPKETNLFLHSSRIVLKDWFDVGIDLDISAPVPEHFVRMAKKMELKEGLKKLIEEELKKPVSTDTTINETANDKAGQYIYSTPINDPALTYN
ncbi:hypothetical protein HK099_004524 [Clydaea vesicula]|uniref:Pseudouridine synthase RsuA/RluA-like domain-containing protein n=1 Tax=Clydaea vesicula TaxID=447962 RepID=A0AAD5U1U1_9FUNG|nr:hypothetical protein HK099_004524 [Clydaea vesicula]